VNFVMRILVVLALVPLLLTAGCDDKRVQQAVSDRDEIIRQAEVTTAQMRSKIDQLKADNNKLVAEVTRLQSSLNAQDSQLSDLDHQIRTLADTVAGKKAALDIKPVASGGYNVWVILLVLAVIVALIFFVYRAFRPRPFEEDDEEDFSSFDDDFGFEDEEEDDTKKANDKKSEE
jgi:hypothetical protein